VIDVGEEAILDQRKEAWSGPDEEDLSDLEGLGGAEEPPEIEPEPTSTRWSELVPMMVAQVVFMPPSPTGPDGRPLTPEELAESYVTSVSLFLDALGFDDALGQVGGLERLSPNIRLGISVAVIAGMALLMKPLKRKPKKKEEKPAEPSPAPTEQPKP